MTSTPPSSIMYGMEASETAPETPAGSIAANALATTDATASLLAHQSHEHTPASSALGMTSNSSAGMDTPQSEVFEQRPDAPSILSQVSDHLSERVNATSSAAESSQESDVYMPLAGDVGPHNPVDAPTEIIAAAPNVAREPIVPLPADVFLARRDDPFVMPTHPGNTRAHVDQARQEMADRIDMIMAPFGDKGRP